MNILLSNHSLFKLGGSETWLRTMHDELVARGHIVHVYTPIHQLWKDIPDFDPNLRYDLGILNHNNCLSKIVSFGNVDKIIFTSHGIIPQPEWPTTEGADVYVSVSEEVQANNRERFGIDSVVIRNPINTSVFRPYKPTHTVLKNVLFLSNYGWTVMETIRGGSAEFNFVNVGGEQRREDIWEVINWADLVVGLGRSVYEAMSCGRNALVHDYQGGDGLVTPENIFDFRMKNCSGRTNRYKYSIPEFRSELEKFRPEYGPQLRDYILEHNNVRDIVDQYLELV